MKKELITIGVLLLAHMSFAAPLDGEMHILPVNDIMVGEPYPPYSQSKEKTVQQQFFSENVHQAISVSGTFVASDSNFFNLVSSVGSASVVNSKFYNNFTSDGSLITSSSTFEIVSITGSAKFYEQTKIKSLEVQGSADVIDSTVTNISVADGKLFVSGSTVEKIQIQKGGLILNQSTIGSISTADVAQAIVIEDTVVSGNIEFTGSLQGRVFLRGSAHIQGEVINGSVKRE